jgi:riboflavin biosynthesis pyrimidine reductase
VRELRAAGVEVVELPAVDGRFSLAEALTDLHRRNITHLLIEPGPTLTRYLLSRNQLDRVWVFRSPREIESAHGFPASMAPTVEYPHSGEITLEGDVLTEHLNPTSPTFSALAPSADLVLTAESIAR